MVNVEFLRKEMLLGTLSDVLEPENRFQRLYIYMFVSLYPILTKHLNVFVC